MRMTTKLLSLLTILFVFFKFGEPANVMMSISGDKGFLFYPAVLEANDVVGFVYDDTNGGLALTSCTGETKSELLTLGTDCIVTSAAIPLSANTDGQKIAVEAFTTTTTTTNMMVAAPAVPPIATASTAAIGATEVIVKITSTGTTMASATDSSFLCDSGVETTTKTYFAADTTNAAANVGNVKLVASIAYTSVIKCAGLIQTGANAPIGLGTFVVISSQHDDITAYFHLFTLPSAVVLHQSINQNTNASTTVGYISGKEACPTGNANLTFTPTTGPCKGKVTTTAALTNYPFITFAYTGSKYYLNVTGVNTTSVTCTTTVTTTTSTDGFAFNFKYSKILIAMMLIPMLKMINGY